MWQKLVLLALAGALGTLARYGLTGVIQRAAGSDFPYGTLVVNVSGCFFAGLAWMLFEGRGALSSESRVVILVGFLGAFTTFSTLVLETGNLLRDAEWVRACGNLALNCSIGLAALFCGLGLGRVL